MLRIAYIHSMLCRLPCVTLHRNKVLCFDSPTRYLLIFDIVFTHNVDEPLKDHSEDLTINGKIFLNLN